MDALTDGAPVGRGLARVPFRVRVMIALAVTSLIPMLVAFYLLFLDILGFTAGGTLSLLAVSTVVLMLSGAIVIWDLSREADRMSQQWRALSLTDELTGTYNRRYCMTRLQQEIARAGRHHHPLCVVLLDVDHFKEVNDQHGHAVGDQVLKELCRVIIAHSRIESGLCRYGGDEFAVILPETGWTGALVYADRIRATVGRTVFPHGKRVTISVGVAAFPDDATDADALFRAADASLYAAKAAGRNTVGAG